MEPQEMDPEPAIHKAAPKVPYDGFCRTCNQRIKRVPGGHGSTWVHSDSGAVVGHGR